MSKTDVQSSFDIALKKHMGGNEKDCYHSDNVPSGKYFAYYTKDQFEAFLREMSDNDKEAYGKGGGKELKEHKNKGGKCMPPKMASYASSSRLIYTLLKEKGVIFEQKLPTSIPRAIANMDGYYPSKEIFIEAKCHEIYKEASPKYRIAYTDFYDKLKDNLKFQYKPSKCENDASITFILDDKEVTHFDIKQTISHLLGIAYACLCGVTIKNYDKGGNEIHKITKAPTFVYMVYNPTFLNDCALEEKAKEEINKLYIKEIIFIKKHKNFFKQVFQIALYHLNEKIKTKKKIIATPEEIKNYCEGFRIEIANQDSIKGILK